MHASAVAIDGKAAAFLGPSGSGKSSLALELMSRGAQLVSDDLTLVVRKGCALVVRSPPSSKGLIEARGVGILNANRVESANLELVVDLSRVEPERLPPRRKLKVLGRQVDLVYGDGILNLPALVIQYLKAGRAE